MRVGLQLPLIIFYGENHMERITAWIDKHSQSIKDVYASLHEAPELGMVEFKTAAFLAAALREAGYEVHEGADDAPTAVIGVLRGAEDGPVIALRADMDALPMTETWNVPWASKVPGVAHTCGHDANMTMVLFAARAVAQAGLKRGTLKIVFQPGEEVFAGALAIVRSGLVSDVQDMVAVHLRPGMEAKLGEATPAAHHGASRMVRMNIRGKASHGARPHLGINAVDVGVNIVNGVYSIHMDPSVSHSAKATQFISHGTAANIVPSEVDLSFDVRSKTNALMADFLPRIEAVARAVAEAAGAEIEIKSGGVVAAEYDDGVIADLRASIDAILGSSLPEYVMPGGEDFHYFATESGIRTAYLGLGANLEPGLHNGDMHFDLEALPLGAKILTHYVGAKLGFARA